MTKQPPRTVLDARYSGEGTTATPWTDAIALLEEAELFWVTTVRPDGRLHTTPVVGVWLDGAFFFSAGAGEQKSRNLASDGRCQVLTGCNTWNEGLDIVLHGEARVERDVPLLRKVAEKFRAKYQGAWDFEVTDDGEFRLHAVALAYRLEPDQALGFGKDPFTHTRWDLTTVTRRGRT